jgi:hypothetical protein
MAYIQPVISSDVGTFSPYLRYSAESSLSSRNVVHELLSGGVAITFGGATLQTSTLEMLFTSEADSVEAFTQLNQGHIFELVDSSKPSTSLYFVVAGDITRGLEIDSADLWTISVDIQQVEP